MKSATRGRLEERTARLTILIDPRKKTLFERLCAEEDATPSQVVRRLIRRYILEQTGQPWAPPAEARPPALRRASARRGTPAHAAQPPRAARRR
jgi:hypothetical protein